MKVTEGFQVEVVAAEPDLVNPVAMTFDDRGRVWVTESLEYPRLEAGPGRDRIKILEDTDHDGRMDKFTVFAEGLNIPSGIAVGHGGVWVANAPDILLLKDTDGDDRADQREVVVTGFGRDDTHELPNSLTWGPDGYLYGLNGVFNRSKIEHQGKTHTFTAAMWRLHPRTREFELFAEGTSNPWGIAWDPEGSAFVSACVIDHLWHLAETGYYHRQAGAYPPHAWKIESIVDHAHQKAAYCGLHYFDSDAYPPEYRDRLYMGNIHGAAINVDSLARRGSTYVAHGHDDFLQANDAWFMPIVQKTGPDGCLYILDWYDRYHCYQDARRDSAGIDRLKGRLYRVRYRETPRAKRFDLANEDDEKLIAHLSHPNVYFRDSAQRLLTERPNRSTDQRLQSLILDPSGPKKGRMHALWALIGRGPVEPGFLAELLRHPDHSIRAWGVRAAGNQRQLDRPLRDILSGMYADRSPDVALQLAIASRKIEGLDARRLLVEVLKVSGEDPLLSKIVWRNLHPLLDDHQGSIADLFERYQHLPAGVAAISPRVVDYWLSSGASADEPVARALTMLLAKQNSGETVAACFDKIAERVANRTVPQEVSQRLQRTLGELLVRSQNEPTESPIHASAVCLAATWSDPRGLDAATKLLNDSAQPDARRLQAASALVTARHEPVIGAIGALLMGNVASAELRRQLVFELAEWEDDRVRDLLLTSFSQLDAAVQPAAIVALSERKAWVKSLLAAIANKSIPREALNENQVRRMLRFSDDELAAAIRETWGTLRSDRNPDREQVIKSIRALVANRPGNPRSGEAVFKKACAACHKIYGEGEEVGPDLTRNGRSSWDQLVSNVFDPSLVIGADYQAVIVATNDGRSFTGLEVEDSREQIVLKLQGGKVETIPRGEIDAVETLSLSLMPEGVERQLSEQEIADLMAFLALDKRPEDPEARLLDGAPGANN